MAEDRANLVVEAAESASCRWLEINDTIPYTRVLDLSGGSLSAFESVLGKLRERGYSFDDLAITRPPRPDLLPDAQTDRERTSGAFPPMDGKKVAELWCGGGGAGRTFGAASVVGYDPVASPKWRDTADLFYTADWAEVVSRGPYDFVICRDPAGVGREEVAGRVAAILADGGSAAVRLRPWCSRTGGRAPGPGDKAFSHLLFGGPDAEVKTFDPLGANAAAFSGAGLVVRECVASKTPLDPFFVRRPHYLAAMFSHWEGVAEFYPSRPGRPAFHCGDFLTRADAWFGRMTLGPVGCHPPNAFGLRDMHGLVWEWCWDGRREFDGEAVRDPVGEANGRKMVKGGGFTSRPVSCRAAFRQHCLTADDQTVDVGFRVVAEKEYSGPAWTNSAGLEFRYVPEGEFFMGSPPWEVGRFADERLHPVTLTRSFYLSTCPVVQTDFRAVMGFSPVATRLAKDYDPCVNHLDLPVGGNYPVVKVTWREAAEFCERTGADGVRYRLPTEAEWEYACRGDPGRCRGLAELLSVDYIDYVVGKGP